MMCRVRAQYALALAAACAASALSAPAARAELPQIKVSGNNVVPECATPGRLTAFLQSRNARLDERFQSIAVDYMRTGEELGIRWDTAFFQMLLETGNLTYKGDVSAKQNNFAGLGATGKGAPGESFADVPTGVKAHLQHLMLYAGDTLDNPVAERTRKIQEWGVLTEWQKKFTRPLTFSDVAKKWAPTSRAYARDIESVSDAFYQGACKDADPNPEMLALARPAATGAEKPATLTTASLDSQGKMSGAELARRAVDEARASGSFVRSNLGAGSLTSNATATVTAGDTAASPAVTILNAAETAPALAIEAPAASVTTAAAQSAKLPATPIEKTIDIGNKPTTTTFQVAALGATAVGTKPPAANPPTKDTPATAKSAAKKSGCRVWTASYGGGRAVIIRAKAEEYDNYTVLDVNEGAEKREADAYIAAYAKGGETVAEFSNSTQAMDKAFELCPEG